MEEMSFNQRFGLDQSKPVENDFPASARIALAHAIVSLDDQNCLIRGQSSLFKEALRTGRFTEQDFDFDSRVTFFEQILSPLQKMEWWQVYTFCERVYEYYIGNVQRLEDGGSYSEFSHWVETVSQPDMQKYFVKELNNILAEENLAYHFVEGHFQRRGRAQTQKSFQRIGAVLGNLSLSRVRNHYNKARKFFDEQPDPDVENCVKETLCALEACLEILTEQPASKDFTKALKQLQGNDQGQVPIWPSEKQPMFLKKSGQKLVSQNSLNSRITQIRGK